MVVFKCFNQLNPKPFSQADSLFGFRILGNEGRSLEKLHLGRNLASDTTQRMVDRVSNYCFDICKFGGLIIADGNNKL